MKKIIIGILILSSLSAHAAKLDCGFYQYGPEKKDQFPVEKLLIKKDIEFTEKETHFEMNTKNFRVWLDGSKHEERSSYSINILGAAESKRLNWFHTGARFDLNNETDNNVIVVTGTFSPLITVMLRCNPKGSEQ